jgi:dihydrofolate synthase/folylpolyglutamate synthase
MPIGNSNTPDIEVNNKYMEYVNRIFRWSMFRGEKSHIHRLEMDDSLVEMRKLASHFGDPQKKMKIIHVAGTNGKGSVTLKVANALNKMGYKAGQFTSPHINSFRERI